MICFFPFVYILFFPFHSLFVCLFLFSCLLMMMYQTQSNILRLVDDLLVQLNDVWLEGRPQGWVYACRRLHRLLRGRCILLRGTDTEALPVIQKYDGNRTVTKVIWCQYRGSFERVLTPRPWLPGLRSLTIDGVTCLDFIGLAAVLRQTTGLRNFKWTVATGYPFYH